MTTGFSICNTSNFVAGGFCHGGFCHRGFCHGGFWPSTNPGCSTCFCLWWDDQISCKSADKHSLLLTSCSCHQLFLVCSHTQRSNGSLRYYTKKMLPNAISIILFDTWSKWAFQTIWSFESFTFLPLTHTCCMFRSSARKTNLCTRSVFVSWPKSWVAPCAEITDWLWR